MNMNKRKLEAIMLINEVTKYLLLVIEYFNKIPKEEVSALLSANPDSIPLLEAALISDHWSFDEIMSKMKDINFDEGACHAVIRSKKLSGSEMVTLLRQRVATVDTVSIGPLITASIKTGKLTGPEIMELLLDVYGKESPSMIELAKPQLEKYIESE